MDARTSPGAPEVVATPRRCAQRKTELVYALAHQPTSLENFKANRRGYWSFWIFMVLFVLSLFAEFIANDKPYYVRYDGKSFFPVFFTYPDTTFGDDLGTAADYRDPHLQKLIAEKDGYMLWPPIRFSYDTHEQAAGLAVPGEADLAADGCRIARKPKSAASRNAPISKRTGSAPTTRAATWWRA